jgi:hypothetical protein
MARTGPSHIVRKYGSRPVPSYGNFSVGLTLLGIHLSELKFHSPNTFWKLFPSAPLLLLAGLVGLYFLDSSRSRWLEWAGFLLALLGLGLILIGDVGQFWLRLDDRYIMTAPAYRAFRIGLVVFAAGSIVLGVVTGRDRTLPVWGRCLLRSEVRAV